MKKHSRFRIGLRTMKTAAAVVIAMIVVDAYGATTSKLIFAMLGAMAAYVSRGSVGKFLPMNANFGIVKPLGYRVKGGKTAKNERIAQRALESLDIVCQKLSLSSETQKE